MADRDLRDEAEVARPAPHAIGRERTQAAAVGRTSSWLRATFKDLWAYTSKAERMLHVMDLLVSTYRYPPSGAAGIVGNLVGESALIPSRLEGSPEANPTRSKDVSGKWTDWTDEQIRDRVYKKSGPKLPGVGIAQWTTKERRAGFFARPQGIGLLYDLDGQVDYLVDELAASFAALDKMLRDPKTTTQAAADAFLEKFENPADPEDSRSARRSAAAKAHKLWIDAHVVPGGPGGVRTPAL